MCDRSSDPTEHDAARESTPLSAEALSLLRAASLLPNDAIVVPRIRAYLARLTEPDAGEGTAEEACDHGRSAHTDTGCMHCACRQTYSGDLAPTPDTTEATLTQDQLREAEERVRAYMSEQEDRNWTYVGLAAAALNWPSTPVQLEGGPE